MRLPASPWFETAGPQRRRWPAWLADLLPWSGARLALWGTLLALVLAVLATLVFLAGRYEASQVQAELERDTGDAVGDLRTALARQVQALQGLQASQPSASVWPGKAQELLREHREWLRIEQRDAQLQLQAFADSPLRAPMFSSAVSLPASCCKPASAHNAPARARSPAASSCRALTALARR